MQGNRGGGTKGHTPRFIYKLAVIMCNKVPALPRGRQRRRRRKGMENVPRRGAPLHQTRSFFLRDALNMGCLCFQTMTMFRTWRQRGCGNDVSDTRDPGRGRSANARQCATVSQVTCRRFTPVARLSRIHVLVVNVGASR